MIKKIPGKIHIILFILLILVLIFNLLMIFFQFIFYYLNVDEFQHTHIAWFLSQGKTLYKDFFEHHGAVYSLLNGFLYKIFKLKSEFNTIYFFKSLNMIYLLVILIFTYLITKKITGSHLTALFAITLLTANYTFIRVVVQHRPDILQNTLFLAGFYIFLYYRENRKIFLGILCGLLFGLNLETNAKALVVFVNIFLFYLCIYFFYIKNIKMFFKEILWIVIGVVSIKLIFIGYFFYKNALYEYFYYNYVFNFILKNAEFMKLVKFYIKFYTTNQFGFTVMLFLGYYFLFKKIFNKEIKIGEKQHHLLIVFTSIIFYMVIFMNMYFQSHLMFLPIISIIGAYGFYGILNIVKENKSVLSKVFLFSLFIFVFFTLSINNFSLVPHIPDNKLTRQKKEVKFILENTSRDDVIAHLGGLNGVHLFNQDMHFIWFPYLCKNTPEFIEQLTGENIYDEKTIRLLKEKNVKYVIFEEIAGHKILSDRAKEYLLDNYTHMPDYPSLWVKDY